MNENRFIEWPVLYVAIIACIIRIRCHSFSFNSLRIDMGERTYYCHNWWVIQQTKKSDGRKDGKNGTDTLFALKKNVSCSNKTKMHLILQHFVNGSNKFAEVK